MESSGEYFKREREQRGIKLQSVYEATRVPMKFLKAIESDDYDNLPNTVFVKGYIKSYCKFIGLDADEAILKFESHFRERGEGHAPAGLKEIKPSENDRVPALGYSKNTSKIAAVIVAVVVLGVVVYSSVTRKSARNIDVASAVKQSEQMPAPASPDTDKTGAQATQAQKPAEADSSKKVDAARPADAQAPKGPKDASKTTETAKKSLTNAKAGTSGAPTAPATGDSVHKLTLKATQTAWVRVRIDGAEPIEATLKPGESVTWKAASDFALLFGNAGGVTMNLDGVDLGPPGKEGEVLSIKIPKSVVSKAPVVASKPGAAEENASTGEPEAKTDAKASDNSGAKKQEVKSGQKETTDVRTQAKPQTEDKGEDKPASNQ